MASTLPIYPPLRFGVRAHDFGRQSAEELALRVSGARLSTVQLAINKAIAGPTIEPGGLTRDFAIGVRQAFSRRGVDVAVLACYINPIHPDRATRRTLIGWFKEHLRLARDFGCGVVALESGSVNADYSPHPDNHREPAFQAMLETMGELTETAARNGVTVGFEAVATHTVSTPGLMRRVLDTIGSPHLQVILDPINLLTVENHRRQHDIVDEALRLLGDRIVVVHAKDYLVDAAGLRSVPAGQGKFDYDYFLGRLGMHLRGTEIILEDTSFEAAVESVRLLSDIQEKLRKVAGG